MSANFDTEIIKSIRADILNEFGIKVSADDPILVNALVVEKLLDHYRKHTEGMTDEIICRNLGALDKALKDSADRIEKINDSYFENTKKFLEIFDATIKKYQSTDDERFVKLAKEINRQKSNSPAWYLFAGLGGAVAGAALILIPNYL